MLLKKLWGCSMFKKILISILSIAAAFLLYYGICHIVAGYTSPVLVGASGNAYFMGLYIMGFTFISFFAVLLIAIILIALYMPKDFLSKRCKNEKN